MVTILGLGFTGRRVARRLLRRGIAVSAAIRGDAGQFSDLTALGLHLIPWQNAGELPKKSRLLHSIPTIPVEETAALHRLIESLEPVRIVYISSTGVYGTAEAVDETTPIAEEHPRFAEESWVASGPWTSLMLRSAAIYGPGRGVHVAIRQGRAPRAAGGVVSRIYVDDLAALADTALFSNLTGGWPVADDLPSSSTEIIAAMGETQEKMENYAVSGRRVDGTKIRQLLNVELKYPTWKTGIPAAIAEESREAELKAAELSSGRQS